MSDANDVRPHQETWNAFVRLLGYSVAGIVVLLILMALFLL